MVTLEHLAAVATRRRTTDSSDASGSDASDGNDGDGRDDAVDGDSLAGDEETAGALPPAARQAARGLAPRVLAKGRDPGAPRRVLPVQSRSRVRADLPGGSAQGVPAVEAARGAAAVRRFESGVQVVQSLTGATTRFRDAHGMINRPLGEDDDERGTMQMDAYSASVALGIPTIASEYLLMAERHGILCRDDGRGATYFYPNFPRVRARSLSWREAVTRRRTRLAPEPTYRSGHPSRTSYYKLYTNFVIHILPRRRFGNRVDDSSTRSPRGDAPRPPTQIASTSSKSKKSSFSSRSSSMSVSLTRMGSGSSP